MKTLLTLAAAVMTVGLTAGGCAIVPYEPAPVVYAPPPHAAVVVRPYYGYYGYHPYWRRW